MLPGIQREGVVEFVPLIDVCMAVFQVHLGGKQHGVHLQTPGPVGLTERGGAGLQPAWQAHGQCLHRGVQLQVQAGMLERELVPVPAGRRGESGNLAKTLKWGKATQRVGEPVPSGSSPYWRK